MVQVGIHEAKTRFSELVARVESGEEIVIARGGKPVARLVPLAKRVPILGLDEGKFSVPEDFNEMSGDETELFEAGDLAV